MSFVEIKGVAVYRAGSLFCLMLFKHLQCIHNQPEKNGIPLFPLFTNTHSLCMWVCLCCVSQSN